MNINIDDFRFGLEGIDDGFIFERFAQSFLAEVYGSDFIPVGNIHDKGIDGLERVYQKQGVSKIIYQISIEKDGRQKIRKTLKTLIENQIQFEKLVLVRNLKFSNKDKTIDELEDEFDKRVSIHDVDWFLTRVNNSEGTIRAFHSHISTNIHSFYKPGKELIVSDLVDDPRVFVFLNYQLEVRRRKNRKYDIEELLYDSLILYSLEGTDPDKDIFMTKDQILESVSRYMNIEPRKISDTVSRRLSRLKKKQGRQVNYHRRGKKYCLPFNTRRKIDERDLKLLRLFDEFKIKSLEQLETHGITTELEKEELFELIQEVIHQIFYKQGLEFSDYILSSGKDLPYDKNLDEIVNQVIESSDGAKKNKAHKSSVVLLTIREMIYNGSSEQREFLSKLSSTYMMLFMMKWDSKISTFFNAMASKLNVYVGTSIIIPALSEYYLSPLNRRHWNLLSGSSNAGVKLFINESILTELASHFRFIKQSYESNYLSEEEIYLDGNNAIYVSEIMIRAYYYAKKRGHINNFDNFIDNFISPDLNKVTEELIVFLKEEFGIKFVNTKKSGIVVDQEELESLTNELKKSKVSEKNAERDASLILSIYSIRDKNNEKGDNGIFGYKTWWLSKDTSTFRAVGKVIKNKYETSCYLRPDFLYNYIAMTPSLKQIRDTYKNIFPTMLGVSLSYHLDSHVISSIKEKIIRHGDISPSRKKAILARISEEIKSELNTSDEKKFNKYLDDAIKLN